NSQRILVRKSTDGGDSFGAVIEVDATEASFAFPVPSMETREVFVYLSADADLSNGPFGDSLYAAWTDSTAATGANAANNHARIRVAYSRDGGSTWTVTTPHETADANSVDRWHQWLAVGPDGKVHVVFYDTRIGNRTTVDLFYSFSDDGAQTWSTPARVTSQQSPNIGDTFEFGDYNGLDVVMQDLIAIFTDNRAEGGGGDSVDVYAAGIPVSGGGGNAAPQVTVSAPANGSSFPDGASIAFAGTAIDAEDGDLTASLAWSSNVDGSIGSGGSFSAVLSAGTHTVTAAVTDSGGLQGSSSITVTMTVSCEGGGGLAEDFEGGLGAWTTSGLWQLVANSACASPGYSSPVKALYYGQDAGCDYDTGAATSGDLISPQILGIIASSTLNFDYFRQVEGPTQSPFDVTEVAASAVGDPTWTTVWSKDSRDASENAWTPSGTISLAAFDGQTIQLRFRFDSTDELFNDFVGWSVDDIVVTGDCGPGNTAPAVTITAPADGSSFPDGSSIAFTGTATDAEDGDLTAGLAWTSSLDGNLGTGGSLNATLSVGTHTVTAAVTDSGGLPGSSSITVTVTPPPAASMSLVKTGILDIGFPPGGITLVKTGALDQGPDGESTVGDLITYTFDVTNSGASVLSNLTVSDPLAPVITCPSGAPSTPDLIPTLAIGATETCTGTYAIVQADVDAGMRDNTATAAGTDPGGNPVSDQDSHSEPIPSPGTFTCTGEAFIVQNVDAELTVIDQTVSPFVFVPIGGPTGREINNLGFRITDGLMYAVELSLAGNVRIVQIDATGNVTGMGRPAGLPSGPRFDAGDVSPDGTTMYITAVNRSLYVLDLTSVPALPPVTVVPRSGASGFVFDWAVSPIDGLLYGGDSTSGQLAILDPATGVRTDFNLVDTGLGTLPSGTAFGGAWFNDANELFLYRNNGEIYTIDLSAPTITEVQTGPGSTRNDGAACIPPVPFTDEADKNHLPGVADPGDLINYTFQVTNTGNVTLTNILISDPMVSLITCPSSAPAAPDLIPSLAPGASETCTGSYAITQADIDAGQKVNTATATSDQTGPVMDTHTEPIPQTAAIDLVKSLQSNADEDGSGSVSLGDTLTYQLVTTNTGGVTLTNVTISDPLPGLSALSCAPTQPATLAPGATLSCTATYVVTAADGTAGAINNTATASSDQTPDDTDSETVPTGTAPTASMSLVKTGILDIGFPPGGITLVKTGALDQGPDGESTVGDLITYTFGVTNSGASVLSNVTVGDPLVPVISCPSSGPSTPDLIPTLAIGATETCTGTYAIVQADLDAEVRDNTATAAATDPGGNPVSDQDTHSEPIPSPGTFACTGEAFIVQNVDAELTQIDQSVSPFVFIPIGGPTGREMNNLGFRVTDGLMYAVELSSGGNVQILQIDATGNVTGLGRPAGLPSGPRFDAGDVSPDGTTMYITAVNRSLYVLDLTSVPALPPVTV
ncbi:MAG: hypothetical protein V3T72_03685, partial [Thermoanaerobaculia bacterium]